MTAPSQQPPKRKYQPRFSSAEIKAMADIARETGCSVTGTVAKDGSRQIRVNPFPRPSNNDEPDLDAMIANFGTR